MTPEMVKLSRVELVAFDCKFFDFADLLGASAA